MHKKNRREGLNSFDLRDAGLTDTSASGSCQALLVPGASFDLADLHLQNKKTSVVQAAKITVFQSSSPKRPVQGEVVVFV